MGLLCLRKREKEGKRKGGEEGERELGREGEEGGEMGGVRKRKKLGLVVFIIDLKPNIFKEKFPQHTHTHKFHSWETSLLIKIIYSIISSNRRLLTNLFLLTKICNSNY